MTEKRELIQYVKDDDGNKIGCVIAHSPERIGWSLCSSKDRFSKKEAKRIARERAFQSIPIEISFVKGFFKSRKPFKNLTQYNYCFTNDVYPEMKSREQEGHYRPYKFRRLYEEIRRMQDRAKRYYK